MSNYSELKAWSTLIFLSIIWGTSFILIKKSLAAFDPLEVAILRISISGIGFAPFFFYNMRRLEWHRWKMYVLIAVTGSGLPAFLYATAQTKLDSASAGILNSLIPVFALIIGILVFKNKTSFRQVIGLILGFCGAGLLIFLGAEATGGNGEMWYGMLIVLGSIFYGMNVNLIEHYFSHVSSIHISSFSFFLLAIPVHFIIPFTDIPDIIAHHPEGLSSFGYLILLSMISTVMALMIFYHLVQKTSAIFGSTVAYLIPVFAIIWGFMDGENIGLWHIMSMAVIIVAVYLIRGKKDKG